jgi:hypothetical protein
MLFSYDFAIYFFVLIGLVYLFCLVHVSFTKQNPKQNTKQNTKQKNENENETRYFIKTNENIEEQDFLNVGATYASRMIPSVDFPRYFCVTVSDDSTLNTTLKSIAKLSNSEPEKEKKISLEHLNKIIETQSVMNDKINKNKKCLGTNMYIVVWKK